MTRSWRWVDRHPGIKVPGWGPGSAHFRGEYARHPAGHWVKSVTAASPRQHGPPRRRLDQSCSRSIILRTNTLEWLDRCPAMRRMSPATRTRAIAAMYNAMVRLKPGYISHEPLTRGVAGRA